MRWWQWWRDQIVPQGFTGLLYEDGRYVRALEPGKHRVRRHWFERISRTIVPVDVRERSLTIKGQEILTADKVAIRVSLLVYFRVNDPVAASHQVAAYEERIYEDVQLAARRFLATRNLEAILSDRNEISDAVRDDVRAVSAGYGVEIRGADVKDLVFPGNLREIMNRVLETERQAEAKLIEARKEGEALRIRAEAKREADRLADDAAQQRVRTHLAGEIEEAQALKKHPEMGRLRELQALRDMAAAGAKFVIGLDGKGGLGLLKD